MRSFICDMFRSMTPTSFLIFYLFFFTSAVLACEEEYRLIQDLKQNYDPIERPVHEYSQPIVVNLRVILQQLVSVDARNQVATMVVWLQSTWNDYKMRWDPAEYGNITTLQFPNGALWAPDILLFNSGDEHFDASFAVNFVVSSNGDVLHAPPGIITVSCDLDMTWFPYDEQVCHLKFGSWTYPGSKLDLNIDSTDLPDDHKMDLKYYLPNGEWDLIATPAVRVANEFEGETYIELFFKFHIKRKTLYYGINWIIPSVLISGSNVLGFTMPSECGEKITLQITNLLSVTVFLGMVSAVTPPTSESIPVIVAFFSISIVLLGCSIVATLVIINVHFRNPRTHQMGEWTKWIFLEWLPWWLLMSRPGKRFSRHRLDKFSSSSQSLTSLRKEEKDEVDAENECNGLMSKNNSLDALNEKLEKSIRPNLIDSVEVLSISSPLESGIREIIEILTSFKERLDEEDLEDDQQADWRFMAMVLDRLSLFVFTGLLVGATFLVFVLTLLIG